MGGKETYYISADKKFKAHKYEYPEQKCTKISLHDPTQLHHIARGERNYCLGCDSVNCCYSDFQMKETLRSLDGSARLHSLPMRIPLSSMRTLSLGRNIGQLMTLCQRLALITITSFIEPTPVM